MTDRNNLLLAACMDCAMPYPFPLDMTLPNDQWEMIHPAKDGLLCANCIVARAAKLPRIIAVRAHLDFAYARKMLYTRTKPRMRRDRS